MWTYRTTPGCTLPPDPSAWVCACARVGVGVCARARAGACAGACACLGPSDDGVYLGFAANLFISLIGNMPVVEANPSSRGEPYYSLKTCKKTNKQNKKTVQRLSENLFEKSGSLWKVCFLFVFVFLCFFIFLSFLHFYYFLFTILFPIFFFFSFFSLHYLLFSVIYYL